MHDGVDAPLPGDARKLGTLPQVAVDAADVDVAQRTGGHVGKVLLDLVGEGDHLLGGRAQMLGGLGEPHAMGLAHEELLTKLALQLLELSRERWLANMQALGGVGDVALLGDYKKVLEHT